MNTVPMITPGSITGISGLTKRPVFFLKLNGSAQHNLVVKGEAGTGAHPGMTDQNVEISVKWGSKLMKNVNNDLVNTKIMTAPEIVLFKAAAAAAFPQGSPQANNVGPGANYMWVKMPYVAGLTDGEYFDDNNDVSVAAIKRNVEKFSDTAVWMDLGKVVAVDIFNGNSDRFDIATGRWVNKGNVMFVAGGATSVVGLDTFDPNSGDLGNLHAGGGFPELRTLIDVNARNVFAAACARSVGAEMKHHLGNAVASLTITMQGPNGPQLARIPVATLDRIFDGYAPDFAQGLTLGATQLRTYLQGKVRQYAPAPVFQRARPGGGAAPFAMAQHRRGVVPQGPPVKTIPQGILDRMAYLGW